MSKAAKEIELLKKHSQNSNHPITQKKAEETLNLLKPLEATPPQETPTPNQSTTLKKKVFSNKINIPSSFTSRGKVIESKNESKPVNTYTLFLKQMKKEEQSVLEKKILGINGVISFNLDFSNKKLTVRGRCKEIEIRKGVEELGLGVESNEKENEYYSESAKSSSNGSIISLASSQQRKSDQKAGFWGKVTSLFW